MNLKKMWKRFWNLNVHNHEGFTLVELIIVIAILAILSSVAVAGYSSYVTKANKQADMTLAAEIKNILMLHHYSEEVPYVWVILSDNGAETSDTNVLTAAFGNLGNLKLKSQWANNGTLASSIRTGKGSYTSSAFDKIGTEKLLDQVSMVTTAASGFIEYLVAGDRENAFGFIAGNTFHDDQAAMKAACDKFGIDCHDNDNDGRYAFADSVTADQISNLLVFATANDLTDTNDTNGTSGVGQLAQQYAIIVAFASRNSDDEAIQAAYTAMNKKLKENNDPSGIGDFTTAMENNEKWRAYMDPFVNGDTNSDVWNDMAAFSEVMNAVDNVSSTVTKEEVAQSGFFASEKVSDYFGDYVDTAYVMDNLPDADIARLRDAIAAGKIVILLTANGNVICSSVDLLP